MKCEQDWPIRLCDIEFRKLPTEVIKIIQSPCPLHLRPVLAPTVLDIATRGQFFLSRAPVIATKYH